MTEAHMQKINMSDFRSNLKTWMDSARDEPIKITRKTGEAFILVNADDFEKMQIELASLRGVAQGLSDVIHGRVRKSEPKSTNSTIARAKERVLGKKR